MCLFCLAQTEISWCVSYHLPPFKLVGLEVQNDFLSCIWASPGITCNNISYY